MEYFVKPKLKAWSGTKLTTVNTYVTVPEAVTAIAYALMKGFKNKTITLAATTNNLLFSIDVSNENIIWINKVTDQTLVVGTPQLAFLSEPWNYIRIQVKPAVDDTHGTISVYIQGSTL